MESNLQECLRTLKILKDSGQIDRAAQLSTRGRLLSATTNEEREQLIKNLIRNRGRAHRASRVC